MIKPSARTLQQSRAHVLTSLTQLVEKGTSPNCATAEFQQVHESLEALPLTAAEFAAARNRLSNAQSYLEAGERGAALYELRLLLRGPEK
jgi:predicted Zn-dependent peptidase